MTDCNCSPITTCNCSLHQLPPKERAELFDRAIDATTAEARRFADVLTIRAACFDVIDAGCTLRERSPWYFDYSGVSEDVNNETRSAFVDAVIERIAELQAPPHSGVKLENLCSRHIKQVLPKPTVGVCVMCEAERARRIKDADQRLGWEPPQSV